MRSISYILLSLFLIQINGLLSPVQAQLGFDLKIDKPKPYEERVLRAEKTGDKPLKPHKKFFQNLTTHYNYFFNANNKLNEVVERAKATHREDYTLLLPFYNYSLSETARDSIQLDSVIYKSQTGIVMHDLRNDWIDNLYLLWGAAWYFEQKFDSAALMFQFINYSFAEKEKDGYYRYIGSRLDGNNALSISTREKDGVKGKIGNPPSRNNAFIWQIRSQIEIGNFAEAGSLIATLRNDPFFPERLTSDLEEVHAYWFYKQQIWDSSAHHILLALDQAKTKQEKARWEFLAAQMLERSGEMDRARELYSKAIVHTTDPVMDIYARLNMVRIRKDSTDNYIDENISELLKMARKDRYTDYRDAIYYMAAQMELSRERYPEAQELLLKSAKYNSLDPVAKNRSYLQLARLSFDQKKYLQADSFYDSIQTNNLDEATITEINSRKELLQAIVLHIGVIERQDSLQRIAAMPEEERTAFINDMLKKMRKEQGLDELPSAGSAFNGPTIDLFAAQNSKGEWYFYNSSLKTQGVAVFKRTWGNRPNVDNWRRFSDVNQQLVSKSPNTIRDANQATDVLQATDETPDFNSLANRLPLTPEQITVSNDSIQTAMFSLGKIYHNELDDYPSAIEVFENLRTRFPAFNNMNELLFFLYLAYSKNGDLIKAEEIKRLLVQKSPESRFASIITTGKDPAALNNKTEEITQQYEQIYDLFIEGRFQEALSEKRKADSLYQTNYWQPQLLYIEAVYHIRQRQDSLALESLQTLIGQDPNSLLAEKAQNIIDVLARRQEIEDELRNLQVSRPQEERRVYDTAKIQPKPVLQEVVQQPKVQKDSLISAPKKDVVIQPKPIQTIDTAKTKPLIVQPQPASVYRFEAGASHRVMIILDKVDPMFVSEAKTAFSRYNQQKFYSRSFQIDFVDLDSARKIMLIGPFEEAQSAIDYLQQVKRVAHNEIVPWLKREKYSFSIATPANLEVLLKKRNMQEYQAFLDQNLPGKLQ